MTSSNDTSSGPRHPLLIIFSIIFLWPPLMYALIGSRDCSALNKERYCVRWNLFGNYELFIADLTRKPEDAK